MTEQPGAAKEQEPGDLRIAIVGAGAVGGYFAAQLAHSGVEIRVIARGAQLEAIQADGIRITGSRDLVATVKATDDPAQVGNVDFVLVGVKSYDLDAAAHAIGPLIGPHTGVVSLQNGVSNEERLAEVIGPEHVITGVAYLFAELLSPAVIEHRGGPDRLVVGEFGSGESDRVDRLVAAAFAAGLAAERAEDPRIALWSKFAFICAQAGTTALTRLPIGRIRMDTHARQTFRSIVDEVVAIARAEEVPLPVDVVERTMTGVDQLPADAFSSLHDDLVRGRKLELDALHGEAVRRAARAGLDVPTIDAVYGLLHPFE